MIRLKRASLRLKEILFQNESKKKSKAGAQRQRALTQHTDPRLNPTTLIYISLSIREKKNVRVIPGELM